MLIFLGLVGCVYSVVFGYWSLKKNLTEDMSIAFLLGSGFITGFIFFMSFNCLILGLT